MIHQFHIPVLGLGYSIDTPLKVARYGISSVVSIVDDELVERMRKLHCEKNDLDYVAIPKNTFNYRTRRITAYLNLLDKLVNIQFEELRQQPFVKGNDICRYFELLPNQSQLRQGYELMMDYPEGKERKIFENILRNLMEKGGIDVNIMAKVDKMNFTRVNEYTGDENTDALAALRAFADSRLNSSIVLSAGMNPRLYSYIEEFDDFFPDDKNEFSKKIILKVSDFRSAFIQAKFLAKKGLWITEFRIESGLNCGGHAFATEGYLLGPILEEFKQKKAMMIQELFQIYAAALEQKGFKNISLPKQVLSVQGGIGTAEENEFLLKHYQLNSTGWGSPFLLVPEVTNVDQHTLEKLAESKESDYFLSDSSPLGVLFNNFKHSTIEEQRIKRIVNGRPGSPCTKKYLCTNTEFTERPICTASREYQNLKIKQLDSLNLDKITYHKKFDKITEKVCLCEGLCASVYLKEDIFKQKESPAVAICPGPNLAYFSSIYTLDDMVNHIYGRQNLIADIKRPHFFVKELALYIDYLQAELKRQVADFTDKKQKQLLNFKSQLLEGINYYKNLFEEVGNQANLSKDKLYHELLGFEQQIKLTII